MNLLGELKEKHQLKNWYFRDKNEHTGRHLHFRMQAIFIIPKDCGSGVKVFGL